MFKRKKRRRARAVSAALALFVGAGMFVSSYAVCWAAVTDGDGKEVAETPDVGYAGEAITDAASKKEVKGKQLTLDAVVLDGTSFKALHAYGGYTLGSGKVTGNKLFIKNGSRTWRPVVGGFSANGDAVDNLVEISGDTNEFRRPGGPNKPEYVYGGHSNKGNALENRITIDGGKFDVAVVGGRVEGTGKAEGNIVTIKKGVFQQGIYGGQSAKGAANGNTVDISSDGGTLDIAYSITGGRAETVAHKNTVKMRIKNKDFTLGNYIYGGYAFGSANQNTVDLCAGSGAKLTLKQIYGSFAFKEANANKVLLEADGGEIVAKENIIGAYGYESTVGNIVELRAKNGGKLTATQDVYGAYANTLAKDNIVRLCNATVLGKVYGGYTSATKGVSSGNTLEVYSGASKATEIANVQNLHFYLTDDAKINHNKNSGYKPMLELTGKKPLDLEKYTIGVGVLKAAEPILKPGDQVSLLKAKTITAKSPLVNKRGSLKQGVTLKYDFDLNLKDNELFATIKEVSVQKSTKSLVETRAALTDFTNRSANMLAAKERVPWQKNQKQDEAYPFYLQLDAGNMRTETGSHVNTKGFNLALGWAREKNLAESKLILSPFVEYGRGNYDSYLDDGTHGSGKVGYLGIGVLVRSEQVGGFWLEGALHGGRATSDYRGKLTDEGETGYDGSNTYYAAHLGIGQDFTRKNGDILSPYLRYFWSHQNSMDVSLDSGDPYHFASVDSKRLRLGVDYYQGAKTANGMYAALAWEYEFSGDANAKGYGFDIPQSPTLHGASVMLRLGFSVAPTKGSMSYDLHITGWQGVRRGISGGAKMNWAF